MRRIICQHFSRNANGLNVRDRNDWNIIGRHVLSRGIFDRLEKTEGIRFLFADRDAIDQFFFFDTLFAHLESDADVIY